MSHTHTHTKASTQAHTHRSKINWETSKQQANMHKSTHVHTLEREQWTGKALTQIHTSTHTHTHSVRLVSVLVPGCLQSRWGFSWFLNEGFSWGSTGPQSLEQFSTAQHPPLTNQGGEHQPLSGRLLMPPLRRLRFYLPVATPWRGVVWESLVLFHGENDQPDTVCWFQSIAASVVLR